MRSAAGTAAKAAAAEGKARVAATRAGGAAVALASKLPFGRKQGERRAGAAEAAAPSGEAAPIRCGRSAAATAAAAGEDDEDDEGEGEGEDGSESSGEEDSGDDEEEVHPMVRAPPPTATRRSPLLLSGHGWRWRWARSRLSGASRLRATCQRRRRASRSAARRLACRCWRRPPPRRAPASSSSTRVSVFNRTRARSSPPARRVHGARLGAARRRPRRRRRRRRAVGAPPFHWATPRNASFKSRSRRLTLSPTAASRRRSAAAARDVVDQGLLPPSTAAGGAFEKLWSGGFGIDAPGEYVLSLPEEGGGGGFWYVTVTVEALALAARVRRRERRRAVLDRQRVRLARPPPAAAATSATSAARRRRRLCASRRCRRRCSSRPSRLGRRRGVQLHPDALQPPAEHGGGALWTSVTLGEARRVVHHARAGRPTSSTRRACRAVGRSVGVSLVDTRHRQEVVYGRAVDVRGAALLSDLEVDTQLTVRSVQLDNQMGRRFVTVINGAPYDGLLEAPLRRARAGSGSRRRTPRRRAGQLEEALLLALHGVASRVQPAAASRRRRRRADGGGGLGGGGAPRAAAAETAAPAASALPRKRPWYVDALSFDAPSCASYRRQPGRARHRGWRPPMAIPTSTARRLPALRGVEGEAGFFVSAEAAARAQAPLPPRGEAAGAQAVDGPTPSRARCATSWGLSARRQGAWGQGAGCCRGLVGAAVKKGEGVAAELSVGPPSLREEGVKKEEGRLRLPRMLHGEAREVRAFDPTTALGWSCLQAVAKGAYAAEPLMEVVALADGIALALLTDLRLLGVRATGGGSGGGGAAVGAQLLWLRRSATLPRRRAARKWR